jgi:hypothetical protein
VLCAVFGLKFFVRNLKLPKSYLPEIKYITRTQNYILKHITNRKYIYIYIYINNYKKYLVNIIDRLKVVGTNKI